MIPSNSESFGPRDHLFLLAVHAMSNDGWTPLCYAAENGKVEVGKSLLSVGANPNHATYVMTDFPVMNLKLNDESVTVRCSLV